MCSIVGSDGKIIDLDDLKAGFEATVSRGPDMTRFMETPSAYLGFQRLAIMDLSESGMQPFYMSVNGVVMNGKGDCSDDAVVCNGEIYGWRKMKKDLEMKGYIFTSTSDCEILLPLYREYGTDMFEKLGSEFALIIYDSREDKIIAARDPIGIRPLYYGKDSAGETIFASEPKDIVGIVDHIKPFPPGHFYKDGEFHRYMDITEVEEYSDDDLEEACAKIRRLLIDSIDARLDADAPLGFLLSGGLDSSLVCAVCAKHLGRSIRTYAIGMETDPIDLKYARETADFIGSDHTEFRMTREEVLETLPDLIKILGTWDITTIRASMGMYLCCKKIKECADIRVLMTGEISDELFGYKYTDFAPDAEAFQEEARKRISQIHMYDVLRADRCISSNSIEGRVPFGDTAFVKYVMSIDPELKMNKYGMGKYLLRHAFEKDDLLPEHILWREKAAFSDAVGHSLVDDLKEYAEEKYSDEDFERLSSKYDHCRPFTKESLLYREIFEQVYPGQADMIADFWMPNKSWPGCDVDDPSARALSNYGESGK